MKEHELVVAHAEALCARVIPLLAASIASDVETEDQRFLCLRLVCDALPTLAEQAAAQEESGDAWALEGQQ